jgi:hypothetical protein
VLISLVSDKLSTKNRIHFLTAQTTVFGIPQDLDLWKGFEALALVFISAP